MRWPLLFVLFLTLSAHAEPVDPERALSLLAALDESLALRDLVCKQISPVIPKPASTAASLVRYQLKYAGSEVELVSNETSSYLVIKVPSKPNEETVIIAFLNESGDQISKISTKSTVKSMVRVNRGSARKPVWVNEEITTVTQTECV